MNEHSKWTIMLYLAGDNDLSPEMVRAIIDIAKVGLPEDFAVTIQYDPILPSFPTFRYHIPAGEKPALKSHAGPIPLADAAEPVPGGENSSSPKVLTEFIAWSLEKAPSTHRMLVLSGHGSGAIGDFLKDDRAFGRFRSLSIPHLHAALSDAKQRAVNRRLLSSGDHLLHILGMDSCLMSTAEVAYQVRDADSDSNGSLVQYLVASEGFVPNAGWPFGYMFQQLKNKVDTNRSKPTSDRWKEDAESIAECLVNDSIDYYTTFTAASVSFDISACELKRCDELKSALRRLTNELIGKGITALGLTDEKIQDAVLLAHWRAQSFKFEQYTDLGDFCRLLEKSTRGAYDGIADAAHIVNDAIDSVVGRSDALHKKGRQDSVGAEFQYASGLSVYFPWSLTAAPREYLTDVHTHEFFPELKPYKESRFSDETGWGEFLEKYLSSTMRPVKDIGGETVEALVVRFGMNGPAGRRFVEGTNKFVEGTNKFVEGTNKFQAGSNGGLSGSMKNPPQQAQVDVQRLHQLRELLV